MTDKTRWLPASNANESELLTASGTKRDLGLGIRDGFVQSGHSFQHRRPGARSIRGQGGTEEEEAKGNEDCWG